MSTNHTMINNPEEYNKRKKINLITFIQKESLIKCYKKEHFKF